MFKKFVFWPHYLQHFVHRRMKVRPKMISKTRSQRSVIIESIKMLRGQTYPINGIVLRSMELVAIGYKSDFYIGTWENLIYLQFLWALRKYVFLTVFSLPLSIFYASGIKKVDINGCNNIFLSSTPMQIFFLETKRFF